MLRSSISQTDLRELRDFGAKAKSMIRWPHRQAEDRGLERSGVRPDSHNVVENGMCYIHASYETQLLVRFSSRLVIQR